LRSFIAFDLLEVLEISCISAYFYLSILISLIFKSLKLVDMTLILPLMMWSLLSGVGETMNISLSSGYGICAVDVLTGFLPSVFFLADLRTGARCMNLGELDPFLGGPYSLYLCPSTLKLLLLCILVS
jgi:hypothetical protein